MKRLGIVLLFLLIVPMLLSGCGLEKSAPPPSGYVTLPMGMGWYDDRPVWFICTTTSDIRLAQTQNLTLAPKLANLSSLSAPKLYMVMGFQQGPVFTTTPKAKMPLYSGFWHVSMIQWLPGFMPRPITNDDPESPGNPTGIPKTGVMVCNTNIVVDYPIMAIGQLGAPCVSRNVPCEYRIPQARDINTYAKTVTLPVYAAYCTDCCTRRITIAQVLVTDAGNSTAAQVLGANYAPGLSLLGLSSKAVQHAYHISATTKSPNPPSQLPILQACPTAIGWRNSNYCYSPAMCGLEFLRVRPLIQPTVVQTEELLKILVANGSLEYALVFVPMNAQVVGK